ncbi:hemolysin XhlA family protein [Paenibacillus sp. D2_2]|uniref:hemolysin XhlA family protein n=1 Tax=Paenibacillus sp. D2_2 TaxID=3073092 RepID=UPI00281584D2|nr:hemolysin XhlA family protein [Paenibacillus sp. D2_2]WMT42186.1 hemolysin XhlA family protein [Paenibacillus sp. D2_2]
MCGGGSARSAHHRLDKIEDAQKWLWRTIAASIITIVVGAILTVIKLQGGACVQADCL